MATNQILTFASTDTGTNLLTQAEYAADSQRSIGHQPGIARSKLENKALRQASLMASGLAEFIADYQANNVIDSLTAQNISDYLYAAIIAVAKLPDGDKGDITVSGDGLVWNIDAGVVGATELADRAVTAAKMGYSGAVLQVVTASYGTQAAISLNSGSGLNWINTGLSCQITPVRSDSKIIVFGNAVISGNPNINIPIMTRLVRGSSAYPISGSLGWVAPPGGNGEHLAPSMALSGYDVANTGSVLEYILQMTTEVGFTQTGFINRDYNQSGMWGGESRMFIMEVAA